ncbi:transcriptional regulator [Burkholderia sp. Ch1-1]|nr:transcriptional regulator [Burkholderia sp. Ch1-1]
MDKVVLPPLNALKAFEATARHFSMKKAAEELNVTAAAISHQIQKLEEHLGTKLFRRRYHAIELTEVGQACLPLLQQGFECMRQAIEVAHRYVGTDVLTIDVPPSFSSHWLMPRLQSFMAAHPQVDVRVSTRMRQFSKTSGGHRGDVQTVLNWASESDIVVAFGNGNYPGMVVGRLMELSIVPLCSPKLANGEHPIRQPEDLRHHVLLHDDRGLLYGHESFWNMWLRVANVEGINAGVGPRFTHAALALEAAIAGRGIVATTPALATAALSSGQLIEPFPLRVPLNDTYCVVSSPAASAREVVSLFRDWLLEEGRNSP